MVAYADGASTAAAHAAVKAAGGTIVRENTRVGVATVRSANPAFARAGRVPGQEPFADKQWDMRMIDATPSGSYRVNQGRRGVLVGIIDSGIDGNHPNLRANFNRRLSRNFTTDIPLIDGPCEHP
ncbi:MAG TPA: peptidase S8, partial [Actinomycetota bacterium]|nr:peptidase S8 [Actinomycetota bacterium]